MSNMAKARNKELHKIIQSIFQDLEKRYVFFGLGVNAFNRLGPEFFIPHYKILSLRNPLENRLIKKRVSIFSLEKDMQKSHINAPRNSNTLIKHPQTQAYIESFENRQPVFLVYKPFLAMEKIIQKKKWLLVANPYRFGKKLFENKITFRKIAQDLNLSVSPGEIVKDPKNILKNFGKFKERYGLPLVIQHPARGGGRGTFFIENQDQFRNILPNLENNTLALKFIHGPSPSITGCVTPWGIAYTYPQYQILDQPECYNLKTKIGNGLWCGHDWTFSKNKFTKQILDSIYELVVKIGEYLAKQKYRGIFGLDFIYDQKSQKIYLVECNPRLLGSFPVLTMVQENNKEIPILMLHILSFLQLSKKCDNVMRRIFPEILSTMQQEKTGAQLVLHNQKKCWARNQKEIKPGIYCMRNGQLTFIRKGYSLCDLKKKEEFLISDGVPYKSTAFSPNRRIVRFITLNKVLKNYKKLTPWAHQATQAVYQSLELKPIRFFKIKKFFNNFL